MSVGILDTKIRKRMARTGESYTEARRKILECATPRLKLVLDKMMGTVFDDAVPTIGQPFDIAYLRMSDGTPIPEHVSISQRDYERLVKE